MKSMFNLNPILLININLVFYNDFFMVTPKQVLFHSVYVWLVLWNSTRLLSRDGSLLFQNCWLKRYP